MPPKGSVVEKRKPRVTCAYCGNETAPHYKSDRSGLRKFCRRECYLATKLRPQVECIVCNRPYMGRGGAQADGVGGVNSKICSRSCKLKATAVHCRYCGVAIPGNRGNFRFRKRGACQATACWDAYDQAAGRRPGATTRGTVVVVDGVRMTVPEIAKVVGVQTQTILKRLKDGRPLFVADSASDRTRRAWEKRRTKV